MDRLVLQLLKLGQFFLIGLGALSRIAAPSVRRTAQPRENGRWCAWPRLSSAASSAATGSTSGSTVGSTTAEASTTSGRHRAGRAHRADRTHRKHWKHRVDQADRANRAGPRPVRPGSLAAGVPSAAARGRRGPLPAAPEALVQVEVEVDHRATPGGWARVTARAVTAGCVEVVSCTASAVCAAASGRAVRVTRVPQREGSIRTVPLVASPSQATAVSGSSLVILISPNDCR